MLHALRERLGPRLESAPQRHRFPNRWRLNLQAPPRGTIVYIRRTSEDGRASFLGRTFLVDRDWCHRLVRAELHLDAHRIRFYALRRRAPTEQPLLKELTYRLPIRPFKE